MSAVRAMPVQGQRTVSEVGGRKGIQKGSLPTRGEDSHCQWTLLLFRGAASTITVVQEQCPGRGWEAQHIIILGVHRTDSPGFGVDMITIMA